MIGLVVMSHGSFSQGLLDACSLICGPSPQIEALSLNRNESIDELSSRLKKAVQHVDTGEGCVVLCDLFGGSPCNVACMALRSEQKFELVSGVNLPMLIEAITSREQSASPQELAALCCSAAETGMRHINAFLNQ